jgi:hypothetical protein
MNNFYDRGISPAIVGLYSPAPQSGKTFTATVLAHQGFLPVSFAEPLKHMAVSFLVSLGYREDESMKLVWVDKSFVVPEVGCSVRRILQTLGTEWGREQILDEVWVRCWQAQASRHDNVVTDDVRFLNEARAVKAMGGQMWKIVRPSAVHDGMHASEGGLDGWDGFDVVIHNDGSLEEFRRKIDAAIACLKSDTTRVG